jgi:hypothetical protein
MQSSFCSFLQPPKSAPVLGSRQTWYRNSLELFPVVGYPIPDAGLLLRSLGFTDDDARLFP